MLNSYFRCNWLTPRKGIKLFGLWDLRSLLRLGGLNTMVAPSSEKSSPASGFQRACLKPLCSLLAVLALALSAQATTSYYVDPDFVGGSSDGTALRPWTTFSASLWSTVNTTLASDDVTIYCSAFKANGATQQSKPWYIHVQRRTAGAHRLILDGHSFYNANTTAPTWKPNPYPIGTAYTNGQVFRLTGDGSQALGWSRGDGGSVVSVGGTQYTCIRTHVASSDNQPGMGPNWRNYWDAHGSGGNSWGAGATYYTLVKQDNVTIHGFETAGGGSRSGFLGDNLVVEYLYAHDCTDMGAQVTILYTSYPDGSAAQAVAAPSKNILLSNLRIANTQGEGLYVGAINPDAPDSFQVAHGNQIDGLTISNFWISGTGIGGGQGDGIDSKNGITHYTIKNGRIENGSGTMGGIICPQTFDPNNDQAMLIENVYIHNIVNGSDDRTAIYGRSSTVSGGSKGYNGVTVRNCRIDTCTSGIDFESGGICKNIFIYNNTIRNISGPGIIADATDGTAEVKNNILFGCNGGGAQNSYLGGTVTSYNNAYAGSWAGANVNGKSGVSSADFANATGGNYHLASGSVLEANAGTPIASFSTDADGIPRPQGTGWDIGAYEYPSGASTLPVITVTPDNQDFGSIAVGTTADRTFTVQNSGSGTLSGNATVALPFSIVSGSAYSLGAGQSQAVTVRYSPTVAGSNSQTVSFTGGAGATTTVSGSAINPSPAPSNGSAFQAASGTITAPFVLANGYIYQPIETLVPTDGGRAVYSFTVTNTANYTVTASVNAPNGAANSLFVNIDAEPQDPTMIWDIPLTSGFQQRTVSWRGNGTSDANQFVPKVFSLSSGTHQLVIRGREANTQVQSFSLRRVLSPPQSLRVIGLSTSP